MLNIIGLYLIEYLQGVTERFRHIGEDFVHLLASLKPLLLGIEHTSRVIQILARGEAEQMVVGFGILFVHEVGIIGAYELDAVFLGQFYQHAVGFLLKGEGFAIGTDGRILHLMALQFQVIVVAENPMIPLNGLAGPGNIVADDLGRNLTGNTGRTDDEVFMEALQIFPVGAGTHIETVNP